MTDLRRWLLATVVLTVSTTLANSQPYLISTFAGGLPGPTAVPATPYIFESANGVATDPFGNTYISTAYHCIFRLDSKGYLSRIAGICRSGFSGDGGSAVNAQFNNPQGLAVDAMGNLYIADSGNQRIRMVTPAGAISTIAGTGIAGFSSDNVPASTAKLNGPMGLAIDAGGNLYIADSQNYRIRRVKPSGVIDTLGGTGVSGNTGDGGAATAATFMSPAGLALDANGNLYLSDNGASMVRIIRPNGTIARVAGVGTASYGGDSGPAVSAGLSFPVGLTVDAGGSLYIADRGNYRVRKVDLAGRITTFAGSGSFGDSGDNGQAINAELLAPVGVAATSNGGVVIGDLVGVVRFVDSTGVITTVAGSTVGLPSAGDSGPAGLAQFGTPWGLGRDASGNLYVADWKNGRLRKINAAGVVSTIAGNGGGNGNGDGGPAISASLSPFGVAADPTGNLYIADTARIRKIGLDGMISTVAGTGTFGYGGDGQLATAALLQSYLPGIAVDANQNIFIADWTNHRVRKVTATTGVISTVVGTGTAGYSGDGGAGTAAQVNFPAGLALDANGNLLIADNGNCAVRKLTTSTGIVTSVAGTGFCGTSGDGGQATAAQLTYPWAVAVDANGTLFIATQGNTIRRVVSGGIIDTVAGTGVAGYAGDGGPATSAQLNKPLGLAVDSSGNVYVADYANGAIRVLQPQTEPLLTLSATHPAMFAAGQSGVFTINVADAASAASSSGTVTLTSTLSSGLTPVSMGGNGWTCSYTAPTYVCQNTGSVSAGNSLGALSLTVNVPSGAPAQATNQLTVTGGGSLGSAANDVVFIGPSAPTLQVSASHSSPFVAGSQGSLTINVANQTSAPPTTGTVTVSDTLPSGFSLVNISGSGWGCTGTTCTNSTLLGGGAGFNPITLTVAVAANAASPQINTVTASGAGSATATASDTITIQTGACRITGQSGVSASDVQAIINEALGVSQRSHDLNADGTVNVTDVQIVANSALNLGCTI